MMGQLSRGAQVALPEGVAVSASSAAKTAAEIAVDAKAATAASQAAAQGASAASAASDAGSLLRQDNQSTPGGGDVTKVEWAAYKSKHKPKKGMPWKKVVRSTETGVAKYKPEINIKDIELHAWYNGTPVTTPGKNFKVFKSDSIIGAKWGKETCFMRVECSANTIHGHPISEAEYLKYLRKQ